MLLLLLLLLLPTLRDIGVHGGWFWGVGCVRLGDVAWAAGSARAATG